MKSLEERRLAAIIFADVVSYSRLIQKNELWTIKSFKISPKDPIRFAFLHGKAMILGEMGHLDESVALAREAISTPHGE